jgi:hypothetical protein
VLWLTNTRQLPGQLQVALMANLDMRTSFDKDVKMALRISGREYSIL